MSLSVKDPEAHRLARSIADTTGETLTKVVIDSPRERQATVDEVMAIAERAAVGVTRPYLDHGDLRSDEYGLPQRSSPIIAE